MGSQGAAETAGEGV